MRILLLSDATMNTNAGGLAQTLYNLFSFLPPEDILCVTSQKALKSSAPSEPFTSRYITFRFELIDTPRNRLARYMRPFADWFNYSFNNIFRNFKSVKRQIIKFNPDIVVSCSNGPIGVFMHHKLVSGLSTMNVFPYFMDDWMYQMNLKWIGGEIHKSVKRLLAENRCWVMISRELGEILANRYELSPQRVLEIHNPVDLSNVDYVPPVKEKSNYSIVYAGSLWPMHFDAFHQFAKAVCQLSNKRKIQLIVYTSIDFWNWRKQHLETLGVKYGGNVPYKQIHQKLSEADALLLVSSFSKEWYTHSKGSIQTKITDYLKARRLIISCGPDYSANHHFLKRNDCGICIETDDVSLITHQLDNILNHLREHQKEVTNGWNLLKKEFDFPKVHKKMQNFLSQPCMPIP